MRAALGFVAVLAACGGRPSPAPALGNREPTTPPGCPAEVWPFAPAPEATASDECTHGAPSPWLIGPGDPPTCHVYTVTGPTSANEAITLADGRRIWLRQSGCVHATTELRGRPRAPFDPADRASVLAAAVGLLEDVDPVAPQAYFGQDAMQLGIAGKALPTGSFPIGVGGDNIATVEPVEGTEMISVVIDFPL